MRVGFVGYGEAAFEISNGLKNEGIKEAKAFDPLLTNPKFSPLIKERAEKANVSLLPSLEEVVKTSDILLVAVPAHKALEVSKSIIAFLNKENNLLYIDVSASSPDVKKEISEHITSSGSKFVDVAMMGPLTVYQHRIPILASGNGVNEFIDTMSPYNMNISKISTVPGDASAIKLLRSIFMKGLSTISLEMLIAANHFNVERPVLESIYETMDKEKFSEILNRLVTGVSVHSERRSAELDGTLELLEANNLSSLMTKSTQQTLNMVTEHNLRDTFKAKAPETWEKVIKELQK